MFPHQCTVPKNSSVNAAIVTARDLTEALTNPASATPFAQFDDAQQKSIVDLAKAFESTIAKPALTIVVPPQPAVLTVPPPSQRVTIPPVPLRVPLPVHTNFIEPDYNGNNADTIDVPCYRL